MAMGMGGTGGVGPAGAADQSKGARDALAGGPGGGRGGTGRGGSNIGPGAGIAPFSRSRVTKTKTRPATFGNILSLAGTILGSLAMPGVGSVAGPAIADALGMGFEGPVGTGERTEADSPNRSFIPGSLGLTAQRKKRTTKQSSPLGSPGRILEGVGGTITRGGL